MRKGARLVAGLLVLAVIVVPVSARDSAGDADETFAIEGVADPEQVGRRPGAYAKNLDHLVRRQAYADAVYHLAAYTQGLPFHIEATDAENATFRVGNMRYQSSAGLRPKERHYRRLESKLLVAHLVYGPEDRKRLSLREGLLELPLYRAQGEFYHPRFPMRRTTLHWTTVKDCYRTAVMTHIAKLHGNKAVIHAVGRVYPVQFVAAETVPVAETEAPEDVGRSPGAAAAPAEAQPEQQEKTEPAGEPPPEDVEPDDTQEQDTPSTAQANDAASDDEAEQSAPPEPPRFRYRLLMDVRVKLDEVEFAEAAEESPPEEKPTPSETEPPAEQNGTSGDS